MSCTILELNPSDFAPQNLGALLEIPEPPIKLWYQGKLPPANLKLLAVVGSRKYTSYGRQVVRHLLAGLKNYPIGIVSGLALGIDGLVHEAAMENNLYTLAIPGSGLDREVLYPATHKKLADEIIESGGGLLSELSPKAAAALWTFPKRNRLMVGLCQAVLMIEAGEKSGTLITARLTADYNRELLAVPGSIFSKNSHGVHQFLKLGATLVTDASDILAALNLDTGNTKNTRLPSSSPAHSQPKLSDLEEKIIQTLLEPLDRDTLIRKLNRPASEVSIALMTMEMQGYIKYEDGLYRGLI